ncbi:MAG: hypothetical protein H8D34_25605, partial [Chloroflexi bacterium]|nr:hypothetical protein [Chloroflexota bacterium]
SLPAGDHQRGETAGEAGEYVEELSLTEEEYRNTLKGLFPFSERARSTASLFLLRFSDKTL